MTEDRAPYIVDRSWQRRNGGGPPPGAEEAGFPGCEAVPMDADQFARFERRVEYWDARRDLAWMVRDVGVAHERPGSRLAGLMLRMGEFRGALIACCGGVALHDRDAAGDVRAMQADQTIYLDAARAWALGEPAVVQRGAAPDVALEVDHTTDSRRRKLGVYEEWAVPEVWIEVPDAPAISRPGNRRSGLVVHALNPRSERYEEALASRVLPGWTAEEIHLALNEAVVSERTWAAVERVGRALGEKEGTEPAPDPSTRRQIAAARDEGRKEGRRAGRSAGRKAGRSVGWREGVAAERAGMARAILSQRGIAFAPKFLADAAARRQLLACDRALVIAAASQCRSAMDFLARLSTQPTQQPASEPSEARGRPARQRIRSGSP